jgi:protein SCO1/2
MKRAAFILILLLLAVSFADAAKTYPAAGLVLRVDRTGLSVSVSCRAILGYRDESVMTLPVRDVKELNGLAPGLLIDFLLSLQNDKPYAQEIRIHPSENTGQEPMAARQLEILDATTSGSSRPNALQIGQVAPDFTLIDQHRHSVTLSRLAGKVVAITFIYTQCPLPNFCFRMSNNFAALHRRFAANMGTNLVLLSLSFDPQHDQPEILAEYARTWAKDDTGWHFLTGPLPEVQRICRSFGVNFWQDEGFMTHSLHTILLDQEGRLAANLEGNEYTAKQLGDLVGTLLQPEAVN